jgi:ferredoxin--NADP+ reductase
MIETGLVFRSVGYRAEALPGLPFDARAGCVPNLDGRVVDPASGKVLRGRYVAGWLKRGPSGVIGSNKLCSQQTVRSLLEDAGTWSLESGMPDVVDLLAARGVEVVDYRGWKQIDRHERRAGADQHRPRVKLSSVSTLLEAAR